MLSAQYARRRFAAGGVTGLLGPLGKFVTCSVLPLSSCLLGLRNGPELTSAFWPKAYFHRSLGHRPVAYT